MGNVFSPINTRLRFLKVRFPFFGVLVVLITETSYFAGYINPNKVLYSHRTGPVSPNKKLARFIPSQPDKVLDAPALLDDYCKFTVLFL